MTLLGVGVAGFLLWVASQLSVDENGAYWAYVGVLAAAGLTMALSQLLGGWTKWGWPRVTAGVFLLGFLPALVAGGLVLLHAQPDSGAVGAGFAGDLALDGLAEDLTAVLPAIAFGIGLTFGFTFDTTGPRRDVVLDDVDREHVADRDARHRHVERDDADEPVAAERAEVDDGRRVAARDGEVAAVHPDAYAGSRDRDRD